MRKILFPGVEDKTDDMPRFIDDMCKPLFDIIRGLHLDQKKTVLGLYWQSALDSKEDEPYNYDDITTTDLALEAFVWNICINQPSEGAEPTASLMLFMEVAHQVWRIAPLAMPNTQGVNA